MTPEAEAARAFLAVLLACPDAPEWGLSEEQHATWMGEVWSPWTAQAVDVMRRYRDLFPTAKEGRKEADNMTGGSGR